MDEILKKDIDGLKFLTNAEINYLKGNKPSINNFLVVNFQEALRNCLLEYLNTPFLLSSKNSKSITNLREQYFQLGIKTNNLDFCVKIKNLTRIISYSYCELGTLLKKTSLNSQKNNVELSQIEKGYFNKWPVLEKYLFFTHKKLSKYLKTSIIHGSCSDLELTPFSDLDTFLIINKKTIDSENQLTEFKKHWIKSLKYLYKFDSLQHHNHMVATEYDIAFFPYHWLPPQIFKESKLVIGNKSLMLNVNESSFYNAKVFFKLAQRFRDPCVKKKKYTEYSLKNDISVLSLLPVLYLQALGINATKKESFCHSKILSIDTDSFLKKISDIRKEWKVTKKSKFIISRLYNFYTRKLYLKYIMMPVGTTETTNNSLLQKEFLVNLNTLIDKMSDNIINEAK